MPIVEPSDIKEYFRYAQNVDDILIEDFITQEEYYCKLRLGVDTLPDDNPILFAIVRDLVIYRIVATRLQRLTAEEYAIGETHRREALRRLFEVEQEGLTPTSNRVVSDVVYTPEFPSAFTPGDFWLPNG